jgi:hypothetical protein
MSAGQHHHRNHQTLPAALIHGAVLHPDRDQAPERNCIAKYPKPHCIDTDAALREEFTSMTQDLTVCFRFDSAMDHRINRILGPQYSTRSRFIRAAIEHLLLKEERQTRLQVAQHTIQWG